MKIEHLILTSFVIFFGIVTYGCLYIGGKTGLKGELYESWETSNDKFKVKITAFEEVGTFMPGAFFECASAPIGSNDWRYFKTYRTDDAVSVPQDRFKFVNDQVAYFYGSDELLVTINSGKDWSTWAPILLRPNDEKGFGWGIKEVEIKIDGNGKTLLVRYDEQSKDFVSTEVFTTDYGQSWKSVP